MKLPKLFIRTPKGRYMPYTLPENDMSDTLFRRVNGKYVPVEMVTNFERLPEGVWIVTARPSHRSITNGTYLRECMHLDKLCDIERFPMKTIASIKECCQWVMDHISFDKGSYSVYDMTCDIVARVYEYNKLLEEEQAKKKEHDGI